MERVSLAIQARFMRGRIEYINNPEEGVLGKMNRGDWI